MCLVLPNSLYRINAINSHCLCDYKGVAVKGVDWTDEQRSISNIGQYNIIGFRLARNAE